MSRLGRRQRFGAWTTGAIFESNDVPGDLVMSATAVLGLNGTVVAPAEFDGVLSLVGGAVLGLAGGLVFDDELLALQGNANLGLAAVQIHAGVMLLQGNANLGLVGTGGAPASIQNPDAGRNSSIVAVGIRGGHS